MLFLPPHGLHFRTSDSIWTKFFKNETLIRKAKQVLSGELVPVGGGRIKEKV
jgi:hypothetical protein